MKRSRRAAALFALALILLSGCSRAESKSMLALSNNEPA